jgi:hypothetical protein
MSALGQKPDICSAKRHVRFTPESGHVRCNSGCPLWANSGHFAMQSSCPLYPGGLNRSLQHCFKVWTQPALGRLPVGSMAVAQRDMASHNRRILADADEERRLALAEEVDTQKIQTRDNRTCAVSLQGESGLIESFGPR